MMILTLFPATRRHFAARPTKRNAPTPIWSDYFVANIPTAYSGEAAFFLSYHAFVFLAQVRDSAGTARAVSPVFKVVASPSIVISKATYNETNNKGDVCRVEWEYTGTPTAAVRIEPLERRNLLIECRNVLLVVWVGEMLAGSGLHRLLMTVCFVDYPHATRRPPTPPRWH